MKCLYICKGYTFQAEALLQEVSIDVDLGRALSIAAHVGGSHCDEVCRPQTAYQLG